MRYRERLIGVLESVNRHAPGVGWLADAMHDAAMVLSNRESVAPRVLVVEALTLIAKPSAQYSPYMRDLATEALHYLKEDGHAP